MPTAQLLHRKIHSGVRGVGKERQQKPTAPTAARLAAGVALLLPLLLGPPRVLFIPFFVCNNANALLCTARDTHSRVHGV